ncbi:hypothetical protein GF386_04405 [Candidatus Pacearchaeota archaeon]|nr:hypothetical protein [Candidatus Pacearchaeota archaeon]MBD3283366.1 hypothetical protein [Candidatus Pacearchaeota archaeon]
MVKITRTREKLMLHKMGVVGHELVKLPCEDERGLGIVYNFSVIPRDESHAWILGWSKFWWLWFC